MKCRNLKELMNTYFQSGNYLLKDIVAHILKFNPYDIDALKCSAVYYCLHFPHSDEANSAIQAVYVAVKEDSGNVKRWIDIGEIENYSGNYCNSELAYRNALHLAPNNTEALVGIARLAEHPGSNVTGEDAFFYLKTALSLAPESTEILYEISKCYMQESDYNSALNASKRALELLGDFDTIARDMTLTQRNFIISQING